MVVPKVYSPAEAAELYGQSSATIKRHCVSNRLAATKLRNGHWIIGEADLCTYAMKQGWSPLVDVADQVVWAPTRRKGIRFHKDDEQVTRCGRSTLSSTSIRFKRRDALGSEMVPCHVCFGEGSA